MNRLRLLSLVLSAALLAACGPDREVQSACERAKRRLDLDAAATERCLQEAPFRTQLGERADEAFAVERVNAHNRDRIILRPAPGPFTRLQRPADVPVGKYGDGSEAEQYLGNRYVVSAQITWFSSEPGQRATGTVFLNDLDKTRGGSDDSQMVGADALNAYQQHFLSEYCVTGWPTMCTGDAYVEIRRDPEGRGVTGQLVGAEFTDADARALLPELRAIRELPPGALRKPVRKKGL